FCLYCFFVSCLFVFVFFFFSSRRRHTRSKRDWSSDVCSSDLFSVLVRFPTLRFLRLFFLIRFRRLDPFTGGARLCRADEWLPRQVVQHTPDSSTLQHS